MVRASLLPMQDMSGSGAQRVCSFGLESKGQPMLQVFRYGALQEKKIAKTKVESGSSAPAPKQEAGAASEP